MDEHDFNDQPRLVGVFIGSGETNCRIKRWNGEVRILPKIKEIKRIQKGMRIRITKIGDNFIVEKEL